MMQVYPEEINRLRAFIQILMQSISWSEVRCDIALYRGRVTIEVYSLNNYARYRLIVDNDFTDRWLRLCSDNGMVYLDYKPNSYNGPRYKVEDDGIFNTQETGKLVEFIRSYVEPYLRNISPYTPILIQMDKISITATDFIDLVVP